LSVADAVSVIASVHPFAISHEFAHDIVNVCGAELHLFQSCVYPSSQLQLQSVGVPQDQFV
jgi:hypothetical protein